MAVYSRLHAAAVRRHASDIVVNSLPIQADVESLRGLERVPVEEMAAATVRKSVGEPAVGGSAAHHDVTAVVLLDERAAVGAVLACRNAWLFQRSNSFVLVPSLYWQI